MLVYQRVSTIFQRSKPQAFACTQEIAVHLWHAGADTGGLAKDHAWALGFLNVTTRRAEQNQEPWLAHVSTWNIDVHMVYYIYLYTPYIHICIYSMCFWCVFFSEGQVLAQDHNLKPVDELGPLSANHGCGIFFTPVGWLKLHNAPGLDQHRMMGYIHPVDVQ